MNKEQADYLNEVCACGHKRTDHNGIDEYCYKYGCKCKQFTRKQRLV